MYWYKGRAENQGVEPGGKLWVEQEQHMHYQEVITGCVAFSRNREREDGMSRELRCKAVRDVASDL
jgi:hypothetical protein